MATTVDRIASAAFTAVAAAISDAVYDVSATDGASTYTGRVVFGGEKAPGGFPLSKAENRAREAYLEGLQVVPAAGWELTVNGVVYYVLSVRDIAEAGGFQVASVIKASDMLWKSATFERITRVSDGAGSFTETWATLATESVGLVAISGQERVHGARLEVQSRWRLICKYIAGLRETDRVVIGGVAYAITFVDDIEARGLWQVVDLAGGVPA